MYRLRLLSDAESKAESSAGLVMKALDRDGDGELSAREFISAAANNPTIVKIIDLKSA